MRSGWSGVSMWQRGFSPLPPSPKSDDENSLCQPDIRSSYLGKVPVRAVGVTQSVWQKGFGPSRYHRVRTDEIR